MVSQRPAGTTERCPTIIIIVTEITIGTENTYDINWIELELRPKGIELV